MDELMLEAEFFDYKGVRFDRIDMCLWACREKKRWLVCSFGTWMTANQIDGFTNYKKFDSFEKACDSIVILQEEQ